MKDPAAALLCLGACAGAGAAGHDGRPHLGSRTRSRVVLASWRCCAPLRSSAQETDPRDRRELATPLGLAVSPACLPACLHEKASPSGHVQRQGDERTMNTPNAPDSGLFRAGSSTTQTGRPSWRTRPHSGSGRRPPGTCDLHRHDRQQQ